MPEYHISLPIGSVRADTPEEAIKKLLSDNYIEDWIRGATCFVRDLESDEIVLVVAGEGGQIPITEKELHSWEWVFEEREEGA